MNYTNRHLSVLIADDHALLRYGIKDLISKKFPNALILEADCLSEAETLMSSSVKIDIVILDIDMPGSNRETIKAFIKKSKRTKILIYTAFEHQDMARRYLLLGARGYLHKKRPIEEIQDAINALLSGDIYLDADTQKKLLVDMVTPQPKKYHLHDLTERELETCIEIAKGRKLTEIAEESGVHVSTVSTLKRRSFEKLNITKISELTDLLKEQFMI